MTRFRFRSLRYGPFGVGGVGHRFLTVAVATTICLMVVSTTLVAREQYHLVDLESGLPLAPIPGMDFVQAGAFAADPVTDTFYQVGYSYPNLVTPRLFTIDMATGDLIATVNLTTDFSTLGLDPDGNLLGMHWTGSETKLRLIDRDNGSSSELVTPVGMDHLIPTGSAVLPNSWWWQLGYQSGDQNQTLLGILLPSQRGGAGDGGGTSRGVISSANLFNLVAVPPTSICGVGWDGDVLELWVFDTEASELTLLSSTTEVDRFHPATIAYDPHQERILLVGSQDGVDDTNLLFQFDRLTGDYLGTEVLAQPVVNLAVSSAGYLVGVGKGEAMVPVLLESHEASWVGDRVEIRWRLTELLDDPRFELRRRSDGGEFSAVSGAELRQTGSAFTFSDPTAEADRSYDYRVNLELERSSLLLFDVTITTPPFRFALLPNRPNPFNPRTTISYSLDLDTAVKLQIVDVSGRVMRTLVDGSQTAGIYTQVWDGKDAQDRLLASGIYFSVLRTETRVARQKMLLLK